MGGWGCRCVTLCCILRRSLLIFCCPLVYFSQQHFFLTCSAQNRNVNQASNRYKCTDTDTDTEINTHRYRWAQVSRVHCISCRGSRSRLGNTLRLLRLSSMQLFVLVADNILRSSLSLFLSFNAVYPTWPASVAEKCATSSPSSLEATSSTTS